MLELMNFRTPCVKIRTELDKMLSLFCSKSRNLKKLINNELQFWCSFNFHNAQKPDLVNSPAFIINNFSTCRCIFRQKLEDMENVNLNKMILKKDGTVEKKKKPTGVKVYILNEKGISSSMLFQEAEKLAQRQRLELKKVEDINGIAAYKLVSISDLLESDVQLAKDEKKKDEKMKKIIISADITPHDFGIKVNHIKKFLNKGMRVFVKLGDKTSEPSRLKALYSELEKALPEYSISKVSTKSGYNLSIASKQTKSDSDKEKKS